MLAASGTNEGFDRYEILAPIRSGGFASVHRARHRTTGRVIAMKISDPSGDPELHARALNEARILASLRHASLVQVFDCGVLPDGRVWVAMDLVEGLPLDVVLDREGGRIAPDRALRIAIDVLSALELAHAHGIVHRDVKPGNLLLSVDAGGREHVVVIDFGISKATNDALVHTQPGTMMGAALGTPGYMAPEQLDARQVDARADLYGVAAVIYRAISGRKPYEAPSVEAFIRAVNAGPPPSLGAVAPGVMPGLVQVLDRALARDRDARPANARVFRDALSSVVASGGAFVSSTPSLTAASPYGQVGQPYAAAQPLTPNPYAPASAHAATPYTPMPTPQSFGMQPAPPPSRGMGTYIAVGTLAVVLFVGVGAVLGKLRHSMGAPTAAVAAPAPAPTPAPTVAAVVPEKDEDFPFGTEIPGLSGVGSGVAPAVSAPTPPPVVPAAAGAPLHVHFVGASPVGDIDMGEIDGFVRRALPRIEACYEGGEPTRTSLLMLFNHTTAPMVSPLSDQSDVGRCAATALMTVIGRGGTRSQGVLRDITFSWR